MYSPKEANKSFATLLKEKGLQSALQSAFFVGFYTMMCHFFLNEKINTPIMIGVFFFFCAYFTWKPKLIRFLRGMLRGDKYRNTGD